MLIAGILISLVAVPYILWAPRVAGFNRLQLSRYLQRRYWIFWADAERVRFMGFGTLIAGLLLAGLGILQPYR